MPSQGAVSSTRKSRPACMRCAAGTRGIRWHCWSRTISRTNGQIYAAWGLVENTTDEKVARTRAAIIVHAGRLIRWDEQGEPHVMDERGTWVPWDDAP